MRRSSNRGTAHPAARSILVLTTVVLFLAVIPVPYFLIGPGSAVDLGEKIVVQGHPPPRDRYFLTDVSLQHATILALAQLLLPGFKLVPEKTIVPEGIPAQTYETLESDYMNESQDVAAVVAERAAGYHVPIVPRTVVAALAPNAPAEHILQPGDQLRSVNGHQVSSPEDVVKGLKGVHVGARVPVVVVRNNKQLTLDVPTALIKGKARFGIIVVQRYARPVLPVPVTFHINNISGSSGGLMFALDIYRSLRPEGSGAKIAGTGTIGFNGKVGEIEGAPQKLIAAKRAGATVFLVPMVNYPDIASDHSIRIVPVRSFGEALSALSKSPTPAGPSSGPQRS